MKKEDRRQVLVRMDGELLERLTRLAEREYRSVNGEIEYLVARAVGGEGGESYPPEFFDGAKAFTWDGEERGAAALRSTASVRLNRSETV